MKINYSNINISPKPLNQKQQLKTNTQKKQHYSNGLENMAVYNRAKINFKGYYGDHQPAKKLFWLLTGRNYIHRDNETDINTYHTGTNKKWVVTNPEDLLKRSPEQAIQSICTLNNHLEIPSLVMSPDYGNKWGRRANYIEINPRTIAQTHGNTKEEGLLNTIKLLPAIPPSSKSVANCVILSELYPPMYNDNDGHTGYGSLYTVNLHSGISKTLTSKNLSRGNNKMGDDEQVKAFNDLAHIRGLKTGIRLPLSEGQMTVQNRPFNWDKDEKAFIDACCWAVDLGFDAIYYDSAKHVGNYDMGNYCGTGRVPQFGQMQWINQQIREKTGRHDIALIGEKCSNDNRFKEMGLTAGNDWGKADNFSSVMHEYKQQRHNDEYAAGPVVSDDNDCGNLSFEQRRNRLGNALNAYEDVGYKLPVYMQMHDLFPLTPNTNTHNEMMHSYNRSSFGDIESNYNNTFNTSKEAKDFRMGMYWEFLRAIDR